MTTNALAALVVRAIELRHRGFYNHESFELEYLPRAPEAERWRATACRLTGLGDTPEVALRWLLAQVMNDIVERLQEERLRVDVAVLELAALRDDHEAILC
jgi:hypothetical protein